MWKKLECSGKSPKVKEPEHLNVALSKKNFKRRNREFAVFVNNTIFSILERQLMLTNPFLLHYTSNVWLLFHNSFLLDVFLIVNAVSQLFCPVCAGLETGWQRLASPSLAVLTPSAPWCSATLGWPLRWPTTCWSLVRLKLCVNVIIKNKKSMTQMLSSLGVYVIGFSYPVVPKGKARIRVQISAAHTDEDIDHCVDAFIQMGRKHRVISWITTKWVTTNLPFVTVTQELWMIYMGLVTSEAQWRSVFVRSGQISYCTFLQVEAVVIV